MRPITFFRDPELMPGVHLSSTDDRVHIQFGEPFQVLSSAVLNGGHREASHFLNVRVPAEPSGMLEDPAVTLQALSDQLHCEGVTVGMMTAASLRSLRVVRELIGGETLAVVVTSGLENARCAGDRAEHRALEAVPTEVGTINIAVITSATVADEALVEMVTLITEAKVKALYELGVKSALSGELATGTGTDAIAVFAGRGRHRIRFAGKHTLVGERLAVLVMQAVSGSANYTLDETQ